MISKKQAKNRDEELVAAALAPTSARPDYGSAELSRQSRVEEHKGGICYVCGCKVYRTEIICGECVCEDDCE